MSDNHKPRVFMVDDQAIYHTLVSKALGDFCTIVSLEDGESALMAASETKPDLILLDVEMPGMGGYETCMRFKEMGDCTDVPIIFLSAHDEIEDRLKGYEMGAQDYITKPVDFKELKAKVEHLLELVFQKSELKSMVDSATNAAMTVMTSMGEMGILLQALKRFNACLSTEDLADNLLIGVAEYGLHGVVQVRSIDKKITMNEYGEASPLEESIIERMSQMERMVAFKNRLSVNYPNVTLLINDMPTDDEERLGRMRDYLMPLVEAADVRMQGILAMQESKLREAIVATARSVTDALNSLEADQRTLRTKANHAVNDLMENFERALLRVSVSDAQEEFLRNTVRQGVDNIIHLQSDELVMQNKLQEITLNLNAVLKANP